MNDLINIYCDESCHLERDHIPVMVIGAVWCPSNVVREIAVNLKNIKRKHRLSDNFETKWVKVSPAKLTFYSELINYFFDHEKLNFRAVVIQDKGKLDHEVFMQDHDLWYYKMFFVLLKQIFDSKTRYHVYLDIKDTRSQEKMKKLHEVLCNNLYDFDKSIIERIQHVRSHEIEVMQLTDLMIGLLSYLHRGLTTSNAKLSLIRQIKERSGLSLMHTTLPREEKFNLLIWNPREW
uniref:DUF3800 domain-containing protein n=1 Tax=Candidatus Desulfatibia profunda TaxID=2841695 RepID=A0A8J6TKE6_9BACT|nr:DUF3800 domain-containing protein [Candidatus Desulfatibia profunda]